MTDVSLSDALKEAYASAPQDQILYHTLEISHPDFSQPVRVVRGYDNITAAGEEWVAIPFDLQLPEVSANGLPSLVLTIDNVSRELSSAVESAVLSDTPITVKYRAFLSSEMTQAQNDPPLELQLSSITENETSIQARATLYDFVNKRFPAAVYRDEHFPSLVHF